MALVEYSDSDESGAEQPKPVPAPKPAAKPPASNTNFSIDKSNPQKIRVKLADTNPPNGTHDEEPAPKRPRLGGGGFSGFNSLLPPPKRDADSMPPSSGSKRPATKVFSLKTGAEPGFSRDSDAELKQFFANQATASQDEGQGVGIPNLPKKASEPPQAASDQPVKANAFMFKPLSVARNPTKKKPVNSSLIPPTRSPAPPTAAAASELIPVAPAPPPKKVSLFSMGADQETEALYIAPPEEDDIDPIPGVEPADESSIAELPASIASHDVGPQNLDTIASDLNLSAADRRQLFGRSGKGAGSAINVANFNTDQEYLANEELRAAGEQVQHNPLRAIAPGKHSLKQLVSAAQGQKEALEESFAQGRRNKKEAGNKYGW